MKTKILRVILFFITIFLIPVLTFSGKKEMVSYNENKVLAELPVFSIENWKNRSFMTGMADFFSDHFVFREGFISFKNSIEKIIGKNEINGVIEFNGNLIQTFRNVDYSLTDRNLAALNNLKNKNSDIPFYFMPVITAQEKFNINLPLYLDVSSESEYTEYCFNKLNNVKCIDVSREICSIDYSFYRTDHHWTTGAAYEAYTVASEHLGLTPFAENHFNISDVSNDFKGTLYSKTLNEKIKHDTITVYKTDTEYKLTVKDKTYDSLYFDEFLELKDKYSYFLSGNYGICTIENQSINIEKKLLIIKDSYANCFVPFLAEHYSEITLVDPRYCSYIQTKDINPSEYSGVLVLFNVSGFAEEQNFALIEFMGDKE